MTAAAIPAWCRSPVERALPWMACPSGVAAVPAGFLVEAVPARRFLFPPMAPGAAG